MAHSAATDFEQVPTDQQLTKSPFYVWEVPERKIAIHLDFTVIDRLGQEVMKGFGAIPRRGAEVGGVLIGTVEIVGDRRIIKIDDYEPVGCEHRRGPSYLLSENDRARLDEVLNRTRTPNDRGTHAVGFYRSHTREGMGLTQEDVDNFDANLPDSNAIFLLIKPFATRVSMAGFFFRDEPEPMQTESSYMEFPFRRRELGGGVGPAVRPREAANPVGSPITNQFAQQKRGGQDMPVQEAAPDEVNWQQAEDYAADPEPGIPEPQTLGPFSQEESKATRFRKTNIWIPLSFIFLLMGVLVGFQAALTYRPAKAAGVLNDQFALALGVGRSGENLHVRWDRTSPAVRMAQRGVLTIQDGTFNTVVDLDVAQLQNPSVFYKNVTGQVKLRLEVFTKERISVSEVLEWQR